MDAPPKIISCEVLHNEAERVNPGYEVEFFEGALHDYPDRLRAAVQEASTRLPTSATSSSAAVAAATARSA